MTGGGTARRPGDCGVQIGHVDDVVAAKLLLGLGVGAVEHLGLAIGVRTVVADEVGRRRPPPTMTRAFCIASV